VNEHCFRRLGVRLTESLGSRGCPRKRGPPMGFFRVCVVRSSPNHEASAWRMGRSAGEPLLVAGCNTSAPLARSKPSRWCETTRAEQDRPPGKGRPKGHSDVVWEWTRTSTSAEGHLVSESHERRIAGNGGGHATGSVIPSVERRSVGEAWSSGLLQIVPDRLEAIGRNPS
jgi:hypothetical protein